MHNLIKIIVAIAMIYAAINYNTNPQEVGSKQQTVKQENKLFQNNFLEGLFSKIIGNLIQTPQGREMIAKLFETKLSELQHDNKNLELNNDFNIIHDMFHVVTLDNTSGPQALCGIEAAFSYTLQTNNGKVVEQAEVSSTLGSNNEIQAIENIVIGMSPGSKRTAILPAHYVSPRISKAYPEEKQFKLEITLEELKNNFNIDGIRIFDSIISYRRPILCGQNIKCSFQIIDFKGNIIYQKTDITFNTSDNNLPSIFNYALVGKPPVGRRAVFALGNLLLSNYGAASENFTPLNHIVKADDYYLIEFYNFSL